MEDALALVHGLLFANVDEAWDGGLDEGAFRGAGHLVSDVRFAIRHFAQEIKKQEKLHEMPLQQCNGAASEEKADCFLTMNCETFRRSLKKRLQRPERSCICMWEEKKRG